MPPTIRTLCFLPLLLIFAYGLKRSLSSPPSDFAAYYYGGKEIIHGRWSNAYRLGPLNAAVAADGITGAFVSYAPFPPFTALVFAPFLLFPMGAAKLVFDAFSCGVFLLTLWRCSKEFSIPPLLIILTPAVFFIPILNNLVFGQAYLLLCSLLLEGWLAYRKERTWAAALFWGLAIVFKLTPAFLFLFLPLRRKERQAATLAAVCGLLLGLSGLVTGFAVWKFYISEIIPRMGRGELNDSFTYYFQSAFMLLKRVFLYDGLLNPHPVYYHPWLFVFSMAVFKALVLAPAILLTVRGRDELFAFGVWVLASMLISPNGSSYSLILLVIPLWALVPFPSFPSPVLLPPPAGRWKLFTSMGLLFAAGSLVLSRWGAYPLWAQFPRLYLLLGFFGLLLAGTGRIWNGWLAGGLALVFLALDIRGYITDNHAHCVLSQEKHLYIYDYTVKDHRLVYFYQDDKGKREEDTDIPAGRLTAQGVEILNNQVYYEGRQLTRSSGWKEKAMLLDGKTLIYLSDENRGIGFYTLRKINLSSSGVPEASK